MIELKSHLVGKLALGESEGSLQILSQSLALLVSLDCGQNLKQVFFIYESRVGYTVNSQSNYDKNITA